MPHWRESKRFADAFTQQIKNIVGPYLLMPAPLELDVSESTDFLVLVARDMRIAARIRNKAIGYAEQYPNEFTIRCQRDSGREMELLKITNGWGDWLFYGHGDIVSGLVDPWWIIDLDSFRAALIRNSMNGVKIRHGQKSNGDGTHFKWFDILSFPKSPPLLVASSAAAMSSHAA